MELETATLEEVQEAAKKQPETPAGDPPASDPPPADPAAPPAADPAAPPATDPNTPPAAEAEPTLETGKAFSFLNGTPGAEKPKDIELPAEFKSQLDQLNRVKSEYEARFNKEAENPFVKAIRLSDEAGLTPEQTREAVLKVASEIVGKDDSNRSFDELLQLDTAAVTKLEGEKLDEAVKQERDHYNSLPPRQKAEYEQALRAKFKQAGGESQTLKALEQTVQAQQKLVADEETKNQALAVQDRADLSKVAAMFKGQNILGLEVSEEMANEIVASYEGPDYPFKYTDERGAFNAQAFAIDVFKVKYFDKLIAAAFDQGKKAAVKKQIVPEGNGRVGNTAPAADKKDPKEAYKESLANDTLQNVSFDELPANIQQAINNQRKQS